MSLCLKIQDDWVSFSHQGDLLLRLIALFRVRDFSIQLQIMSIFLASFHCAYL
ncbi:hypothetical protein Lmor_0728 [Legionella moravica]|uniref:Uncharacterized protein n=1 Tax=Legionella moravica TaxID=39962 RepID=A0A378JX58_9GAMM|nr:hypothetical protein Lmor_0728 [Legionella moravica]STX62607.1 Uncharacterised protein [Legionella moravica]